MMFKNCIDELVARADFPDFPGLRRLCPIQIAMEAEVSGDERLIGIFNDVFPVMELRVLPHKGLAVAVGDRIVKWSL
jgi:hypothetical protein